MADNTVKFGLKKVKYALWDEDSKEYGTLVELPGAVSWTQTREGSDSSDFYADDGVYYTMSGTNGGYSAELELAYLTDDVRIDLLGEIADETTGIQFETTDAEYPQFAIMFETTGDKQTTGFVFYNCKASRPEMNANTKNDNPDVDTVTLNIRIAAQTFTYDGKKRGFVQGHIDNTDANASRYSAFFSTVVTPSTAGQSGLSA